MNSSIAVSIVNEELPAMLYLRKLEINIDNFYLILCHDQVLSIVY